MTRPGQLGIFLLVKSRDAPGGFMTPESDVMVVARL